MWPTAPRKPWNAAAAAAASGLVASMPTAPSASTIAPARRTSSTLKPSGVSTGDARRNDGDHRALAALRLQGEQALGDRGGGAKTGVDDLEAVR